MEKQTEINPGSAANGAPDEARPFGRMLVAMDDSRAAEAALGLVAEWVQGPGAEVRFVRVTEERSQRVSGAVSGLEHGAVEQAHRLVVSAPTLGARNRQVVHGIAEAAADFGADVIVLGFDRPRLAGHRFAPSLREQIMRATYVPVLVTPGPQSEGEGPRRLEREVHQDQEPALAEDRYVHV
jgi:nucleotide-binding universal stress UspA family protein